MCEDSLYSVRVAHTKNVVDTLEVHNSEHVYDSTTIHNSRNIFYSQNCYDCSFSAFIYNCRGCHNCICCSNLVNQSYYIFNKPVPKEEYKQVWAELFDGTRTSMQKFQKLFKDILDNTLRKNLNITNCENSIGYNISNCKDTLMCEESYGVENIRYCDRVECYGKAGDFMDVTSW